MNVWLDGLSALTGYAWAVFVVLLIILWGSFIAHRFLFRIFGNSLTEADLLTFGAAGWVVPVLLLSLFAFGTSLLINELIGGIFALAIILILSFVLVPRKIVVSQIFFLLAFVFASLILRFAFLEGLVLPSYFDSAEHYRLIQLLTESYHTGTLSTEPLTRFYHLGFHSIVAFISHFLHVRILDLVLVFGQVVLAILPIPFFFIVKRETDSTFAALLACLLAGFGFHMPSHLMNWGKYPALFGLVSMMPVFGLAYMAYRSDLFKERKSIFIVLSVAIFVSMLLHSRTLVIYGFMFIAVFITFGWMHLKDILQKIIFATLFILIIIEIYAVYGNPTLQTLFDVYLKNDLWMLILVLFLTIFAAIRHIQWTFFLFTWIALCVLSLFIPIFLPTLGTQTLLDRPFVQMFAFIPLSMLGGLGLAGLIQTTQRLLPDLKLLQRFIPIFIFWFVLLNTVLHYNFYPSNCCRFATRDDLAAFTWIENHVPEEASILIASSGLSVTSFESTTIPVGVDAGIWIPPLLARSIRFSKPAIQFDLSDTHADLCAGGIDYIYVGSMPQSFNASQLDGLPVWYARSFILPSAKIYQVMGCKD